MMKRLFDRQRGSTERYKFSFTSCALYLWMFSLPFDVIVPDWLPPQLQGNLSITRIVGIMLALCFVLDPKTRPWKLPPASLAFATFFAVFSLSMLRSDFSAVVTVFQQLQFIVVFLICYNVFLKGQATLGALYAYAIACASVSIMALTGYADSGLTELETGGREYVFGADPNLYGKLLIIGVLIAIGLGHIRAKRKVIFLPLLWAIVLAIIIVIAKSGSRGMTLALGVGLAVFVLRSGSIWIKLRNGMLLTAIAFASFFFTERAELLKTRWLDTIETRETSQRDQIFSNSLGMFQDEPVFGWGTRANSELARRLLTTNPTCSTHNSVLSMLIFCGLAGSLPLLWGYFVLLYYAWHSRYGEENILPFAILITIFLADMSTGGLPEKIHWTLFAYILASGKRTVFASGRIKIFTPDLCRQT